MRGRIKITRHKRGKATLSGIPFQDLRSLLTAASLWRHEHGEKPDDFADTVAWHRRQRAILDMCEQAVDRAIDEANGRTRMPLTREARLEAVRQSRRIRQQLAAIHARYTAIVAEEL